MSRTAFVLTLVLCWIPGGLIHHGQQQANPNAESIAGLVVAGTACAPVRWGQC
jgi:hypothetical protein